MDSSQIDSWPDDEFLCIEIEACVNETCMYLCQNVVNSNWAKAASVNLVLMHAKQHHGSHEDPKCLRASQ